MIAIPPALANDKRLTPRRADFDPAGVRPETMTVRAARLGLRARADLAQPLDAELLHGERFEVYERRGEWVWGQAALDAYVGWARAIGLGAEGPAPSHRVAVLRTLLFPEPDIKSPPRLQLSLAARLAITGETGRFVETADGGFVIADHLTPLATRSADHAGEALRLLGAPYRWGGREAGGLDCSGLVQLAMLATGRVILRDSDMQEASVGEELAPEAPLARGDLIFWRGHMGVMLDDARLLHANAHHMAVAIEPLAEATARISAKGFEITRRRRP